MSKIIYSRGFPYGAPMVWIRGGGTRDPEVKTYLKGEGFYWNGSRHAWESAMYADDLTTLLSALKGKGYAVVPKDDMDPSYILDI